MFKVNSFLFFIILFNFLFLDYVYDLLFRVVISIYIYIFKFLAYKKRRARKNIANMRFDLL